MSKAIKYGTNLAIVGGVGNGIVNIIKQLDRMKNNPDNQFDWRSLFLAIGKGGLIGGGIGLVSGAIVDYRNSLKHPINTDAFLFNFVAESRLNKKHKTYSSINVKAEELIRNIKSHFHTDLAHDPIKGGSSIKGTALRENFDIDIYLPFRPESFSSTRKMSETVYDFLESQKSKFAVVRLRQQGKSIGMFFLIDGKELKIDIVPYKLTKAKGKKTSGYLHVRKQTIWGEKSTYTKTDVHALNSIHLTKTQKDILIVLKEWRNKNMLPLNSHLLQNLILDAYLYNQVPRGLTKKVVMVLQHIADKLNIAVIRSIENTNNVLTDISPENKSIIIRACKDAIEDYKYQPNSIVKLVS